MSIEWYGVFLTDIHMMQIFSYLGGLETFGKELVKVEVN